VITIIGGTLGLTSAYGLGDATLTRRRVEADLAVFCEYQMKYRGMLAACTEQLNWGVERYADLPPSPALLDLEDVPSFWKGLKGLGIGLAVAPLWFAFMFIVAMIVTFLSIICCGIYEMVKNLPIGTVAPWEKPLNSLLLLLLWGGIVLSVLSGVVSALSGPYNHFRVIKANGNKPSENARRKRAHEEAVAAALKVAERAKAAEDHRLRYQIREVEGFAKTVGEKEAAVRRILATL
jgi:hypothetical protein